MAPSSAEVESYVDETARLLGVRMDAADRALVVSLFSVLARHAETLMAHELPESIEPGPVFRIPAERDV
jgi:hypothetical protein